MSRKTIGIAGALLLALFSFLFANEGVVYNDLAEAEQAGNHLAVYKNDSGKPILIDQFHLEEALTPFSYVILPLETAIDSDTVLIKATLKVQTSGSWLFGKVKSESAGYYPVFLLNNKPYVVVHTMSLLESSINLLEWVESTFKSGGSSELECEFYIDEAIRKEEIAFETLVKIGKNGEGAESGPVKGKTTKKKALILIHGWRPADKEDFFDTRENRITDRLEKWKSLIRATTDTTAFEEYDIYAYVHDGTFSTASFFAEKLRDILVADGFFEQYERIDLIGHSMGGLISRYLANEETPAGEKVGDKVGAIITFNTPHEGSPFGSLYQILTAKMNRYPFDKPGWNDLLSDIDQQAALKTMLKFLFSSLAPGTSQSLNLSAFGEAIIQLLRFNPIMIPALLGDLNIPYLGGMLSPYWSYRSLESTDPVGMLKLQENLWKESEILIFQTANELALLNKNDAYLRKLNVLYSTIDATGLSQMRLAASIMASLLRQQGEPEENQKSDGIVNLTSLRFDSANLPEDRLRYFEQLDHSELLDSEDAISEAIRILTSANKVKIVVKSFPAGLGDYPETTLVEMGEIFETTAQKIEGYAFDYWEIEGAGGITTFERAGIAFQTSCPLQLTAVYKEESLAEKYLKENLEKIPPGHYLLGQAGIEEVQTLFEQGDFEKASVSFTFNGLKRNVDEFVLPDGSHVEVYKSKSRDSISLIKDKTTGKWTNDREKACYGYLSEYLSFQASMLYNVTVFRKLLDLSDKTYALYGLYDSVNLVKEIVVAGGSLFINKNPVSAAKNLIEAFSQIGLTLIRQKRAENVTKLYRQYVLKAYDLLQSEPKTLTFDDLIYLASFKVCYEDLQELFIATFNDLMGHTKEMTWLHNLWEESKNLLEDLSDLGGVAPELEAFIKTGIGLNKLYGFGEAAVDGDTEGMIKSAVELLIFGLDTALDYCDSLGKIGGELGETTTKVLKAYEKYQLGAKTAQSAINFLLEYDFSGLLGFEMKRPCTQLAGVIAGVNWVDRTYYREIDIPDPNLDMAIRQAKGYTGRASGPIYRADVEGITSLTAIEKNINSFEGIENLTNLESLQLKSNNIEDITPLGSLTNLKYLRLEGNRISELKPLRNLNHLLVLELGDNAISDITALSNLTGLYELNLALNGIKDITPLKNLTGLQKLYISYNEIEDLSPISGLTQLESLNFWNNAVRDIRALQELTFIRDIAFGRNPVTDLSSLINNEGMKEGVKLDIRGIAYDPEKLESLYEDVKTLEARGVVIQHTLPVPEEPYAGEMVYVKGGTFQMGDEVGDLSEFCRPIHTVVLSYDFWIGKYEVTFDDYDEFSSSVGKPLISDNGWGRGKRPIISVNWLEAIGYCNWLSEKEGIANAYDSNGNLLDRNGNITTDIKQVEGYRLPTEAEWEFAAKGGNSEGGNYQYAGSDDLDDVGWYWKNSGDSKLPGDDSNWDWPMIVRNNSRTHETGQKDPNGLGIHDLSGNVFEWCHDWFGLYTADTYHNPIGTKTRSDFKVTRGGGWSYIGLYNRIENRSYGNPVTKAATVGFRIARTKIE